MPDIIEDGKLKEDLRRFLNVESPKEELFDALCAEVAHCAQLEEKLRLAKVEIQSAWDSEAQWKAACQRIATERDELRDRLNNLSATRRIA